MANESLDTDAVMQGLLQLPNTPDPDTKLSPAQILLGRKGVEHRYLTQQVQSGRNRRLSGEEKRMH